MRKRVTFGNFVVCAFLALATMSCHAEAEGFMIVEPNHTMIFAPLPSAGPRIINIPPHSDPAHEKAWEEFCQPKAVMGKYGVEYLHYAHEGCEYGRTE